MLRGSFWLRLTSSGNLIGEFTNNANTRIFSESADAVEPVDLESFEGDYISTWQEDRAPLGANLKITQAGQKFNLIWTRIDNGSIIFRGEGFLVGDLLIGHYEI